MRREHQVEYPAHHIRGCGRRRGSASASFCPLRTCASPTGDRGARITSEIDVTPSLCFSCRECPDRCPLAPPGRFRSHFNFPAVAPTTTMTARTLYDKLWDDHVVHTEEDG